MSHKAIILAAGLGTRLSPMTDDRPKALVEYHGKPLLDHVVLKLKKSGFKEIIINIHHFADQIVEYVESKKSFGIRIEFSDEREKLLNTGGAIKHAKWFFDDSPFLVYNVDILCTIDLQAMYSFHVMNKPLATLAVKERKTSRSLLMDNDNRLVGWQDNITGERIIVNSDAGWIPIAFSAIHVIDPAIFNLFPSTDRFSIIETYLELAGENRIMLYRHDHDHWQDMGKKESYAE